VRLPFLAQCPYSDPPSEEAAVAAKTLSVSASITQNPAGAPTPQAIIVAVSAALSDPAFATVAPWTAVITVTSS
jgi:hypothetical protein